MNLTQKVQRCMSSIICCLFLSCSFATPRLMTPKPLFTQKVHLKVEKPEFISLPSPNYNERPGTPISAIVLHHTATLSNATDVAKFFANPQSGVSSHYIVDRTGYIVQPVEDQWRAWHAGKSEFEGTPNVNHFSIGIEICNVGDSQEPYPEAQYDAVIRLVAYLVQTYHIPLPRLTRHRDVALPLGRKIDTSDNFSMPKVLEGVQALLEGTYSPPPLPPVNTPDTYPTYREVIIKEGETSFKLLADIYLDNENRWSEIRHLNPELSDIQSFPAGLKVKIPTDYRFFR